jgi:hypothetical protein
MHLRRALLPCLVLACCACSQGAGHVPARTEDPLRNALSTHDQKGKLLGGAHSYRLTLPADMHGRSQWTLMVRDPATHALLATSPASLSSTAARARANPDGSIDIWFGPSPPERENANWLQTDPHIGFEVAYRFEGPTTPATSWKPPVVERLKECYVCKMKRQHG